MDLESVAAAQQVQIVEDTQPSHVEIPEQQDAKDVEPVSEKAASELPDSGTAETPKASSVKPGDRDKEYIRPSLRLKRYLEQVGKLNSKSFYSNFIM